MNDLRLLVPLEVLHAAESFAAAWVLALVLCWADVLDRGSL